LISDDPSHCGGRPGKLGTDWLGWEGGGGPVGGGC